MTIPGYTMTSAIYEGSNTLVFRATRNSDNLSVILKTLKRDVASPPQLARLKREYDLAKMLKLPDVIAVLALESYDNNLAIVMEDPRADSLAQMLQSRKLDLPDFLKLAARIARVIGDVHRQQIMHLDINPSNFLWNPETDTLKLIDFGISAKFSHAAQDARNPNVLEGTLAYMAPEQTGRINRTVDYRTDLYSLGVTFYEMLLGFLPFQATDTMELVHCHLARTPKSPHELNHHIPQPVSDIVMKLMAKTAEERYQSAAGVIADLQKCQEQLQFTGQIQYVAIGHDDISDTFVIPPKLYGRARETEALLKEFEFAQQGQSVFALVSGYAGIGKSALVHEISKTIFQQRGYFVTGRFERFKRNVPYSGFIQAFQELIQHLLTESEPTLAVWREKLSAAIETGGHLMIDLIPELELILGTQPKSPILTSTESRNRLHASLQNVVRVFSTSGHPLVIFLDNLQWADFASLNVLQQLLSSVERQALMMIGAYRDSDVLAHHPVRKMLDALLAQNVRIRQIELAPLSLVEVSSMLAETLHGNKEDLFPLARIILEKTGGNPSAIKEFLRAIYAEELLSYDDVKGRWDWNPDQIRGMAMTENVVEFMISKLHKLPANTQRILQCAACIGNRFDLHTLSAVMEQSETQTSGELEAAMRDGFVVPADESHQYMKFFNAAELREFAAHVIYNFAHNRFQEAMLGGMTPQEIGRIHLKIGRHLLHCGLHQTAEQDALAEIVGHVNRGLAFIETDAEKVEVVRLNAQAVKQAKMAAQYDTARQYVTQCVALLGEKRWQAHYDATFELFQEWADIECLSGNFEQAESLCRQVLEQARTPIETASIYRLLITQYTLHAAYHTAIDAGKTAMALLEFPLPSEHDAGEIDDEITEIQRILDQTKRATLLHAPALTQPAKIAAMQILETLLIPAWNIDPLLHRLIIAQMMRISLKDGHCPASATAYALYGVFVGSAYHDHAAANVWGALALKVSDLLQSPTHKAKASCIVAAQILPWVRYIKESHRLEHDAYQIAMSAGEVHLAGVALTYRLAHLWHEGANLEQFLQHIAEFSAFTASTRDRYAAAVMTACQLIAHNLRGLTLDCQTFQTDSISEEAFLQQCRDDRHTFAICAYYIMKARVLCLYGLFQEAQAALGRMKHLRQSMDGFLLCADAALAEAFCVIAKAADAPENARERLLADFRQIREQFHQWAQNCPENFLHLDLLLQAEHARLTKQPFLAMQRYQEALDAAQRNEFIHHRAFIHEAAGNFYLAAGFQEFAALHFQKAYYDYIWWGSPRKVTELLRQRPEALSEIARTAQRSLTRREATSTGIRLDRNADGLSVLDLNAVMKASQTISSEIVLSSLLKQMMKIVIENAGAQKGWLILHKHDQWVIEAEGAVDSETVTVQQSIPIGTVGGMQNCPVPCTLIHYVIRTGESVVLEHAAREGKFTYDPHILKHQVKSVLCIPLIKHGQLNGVIYLENNVTSGVFTEDRLKVINMLSAQMVVSLENATLYKQLNDALENQVKLANEQVELTNAYSRFVPREFLSLLGKKSIVDVQLGEPLEKEITIMFSDIRGFTELSEQMTPQENFNFINSYLHHQSPVIREHHGFIDKYIGDGIMALFPTNADEAVKASIAMLEKLKIYNQGRTRAGYRPINIGIGLNTGVLMLGTVGDQERMDGTVISDAVNLASRIESMTKIYGVSLLISETTYFQLENPADYAIRIIDQVQAKGKSEPVTVFEVFNADPPNIVEAKLKTMVLFRQGFKLYHRTKFAEAQALFNEVLEADAASKQQHIAEAKELFEEILHVNPHDKVARLYLDRCEQIQKYGVPDEWAGVWAWVTSLKNRG